MLGKVTVLLTLNSLMFLQNLPKMHFIIPQFQIQKLDQLHRHLSTPPKFVAILGCKVLALEGLLLLLLLPSF